LIAILLTISAFELEILQQQPGVCRRSVFKNQGDSCSNAWNSTSLCKQFLTCVGGTCKPGWIGASCTQSSDCYLSSPWEEGIRCINSKCTKKRYNGYPCQLNDECYGSSCINGICAGYGAGETCDPTAPVQCEKGLYCSYYGRLCLAQKRVGEACDDYEPGNMNNMPEGANYFIICPGGSRCNTRQGNVTICRNVYSKRSGEACDTSEDCYQSFLCRGGKCVDRFVGGVNDMPCTGSRNCSSTANEQCVCIEGQQASCQQTANPGCSFTNTMIEWTDCWRRSNCHFERNVFTAMQTETFQKETCMGQSCGNIPRAAFCCRNNGYSGKFYSQANIDPFQCSGGGSSSVLTGVFVVIVLIFITGIFVGLAIFGIWLYQRRRQESFEQLD